MGGGGKGLIGVWRGGDGRRLMGAWELRVFRKGAFFDIFVWAY